MSYFAIHGAADASDRLTTNDAGQRRPPVTTAKKPKSSQQRRVTLNDGDRGDGGERGGGGERSNSSTNRYHRYDLLSRFMHFYPKTVDLVSGKLTASGKHIREINADPQDVLVVLQSQSASPGGHNPSTEPFLGTQVGQQQDGTTIGGKGPVSSLDAHHGTQLLVEELIDYVRTKVRLSALRPRSRGGSASGRPRSSSSLGRLDSVDGRKGQSADEHQSQEQQPQHHSFTLNLAIVSQLRTVILSNNCLQDLTGLVMFPNIRQLSLQKNHVGSIHACVPLQFLPHLAHLSLEYNPVTHLPYYRSHIIALCCNKLDRLDGSPVTPRERSLVRTNLQIEESYLLNSCRQWTLLLQLEDGRKKLLLHAELFAYMVQHGFSICEAQAKKYEKIKLVSRTKAGQNTEKEMAHRMVAPRTAAASIGTASLSAPSGAFHLELLLRLCLTSIVHTVPFHVIVHKIRLEVVAAHRQLLRGMKNNGNRKNLSPEGAADSSSSPVADGSRSLSPGADSTTSSGAGGGGGQWGAAFASVSTSLQQRITGLVLEVESLTLQRLHHRPVDLWGEAYRGMGTGNQPEDHEGSTPSTTTGIVCPQLLKGTAHELVNSSGTVTGPSRSGVLSQWSHWEADHQGGHGAHRTQQGKGQGQTAGPPQQGYGEGMYFAKAPSASRNEPFVCLGDSGAQIEGRLPARREGPPPSATHDTTGLTVTSCSSIGAPSSLQPPHGTNSAGGNDDTNNELAVLPSQAAASAVMGEIAKQIGAQRTDGTSGTSSGTVGKGGAERGKREQQQQHSHTTSVYLPSTTVPVPTRQVRGPPPSAVGVPVGVPAMATNGTGTLGGKGKNSAGEQTANPPLHFELQQAREEAQGLQYANEQLKMRLEEYRTANEELASSAQRRPRQAVEDGEGEWKSPSVPLTVRASASALRSLRGTAAAPSPHERCLSEEVELLKDKLRSLSSERDGLTEQIHEWESMHHSDLDRIAELEGQGHTLEETILAMEDEINQLQSAVDESHGKESQVANELSSIASQRRAQDRIDMDNEVTAHHLHRSLLLRHAFGSWRRRLQQVLKFKPLRQQVEHLKMKQVLSELWHRWRVLARLDKQRRKSTLLAGWGRWRQRTQEAFASQVHLNTVVSKSFQRWKHKWRAAELQLESYVASVDVAELYHTRSAMKRTFSVWRTALREKRLDQQLNVFLSSEQQTSQAEQFIHAIASPPPFVVRSVLSGLGQSTVVDQEAVLAAARPRSTGGAGGGERKKKTAIGSSSHWTQMATSRDNPPAPSDVLSVVAVKHCLFKRWHLRYVREKQCRQRICQPVFSKWHRLFTEQFALRYTEEKQTVQLFRRCFSHWQTKFHQLVDQRQFTAAFVAKQEQTRTEPQQTRGTSPFALTLSACNEAVECCPTVANAETQLSLLHGRDSTRQLPIPLLSKHQVRIAEHLAAEREGVERLNSERLRAASFSQWHAFVQLKALERKQTAELSAAQNTFAEALNTMKPVLPSAEVATDTNDEKITLGGEDNAWRRTIETQTLLNPLVDSGTEMQADEKMKATVVRWLTPTTSVGVRRFRTPTQLEHLRCLAQTLGSGCTVNALHRWFAAWFFVARGKRYERRLREEGQRAKERLHQSTLELHQVLSERNGIQRQALAYQEREFNHHSLRAEQEATIVVLRDMLKETRKELEQERERRGGKPLESGLFPPPPSCSSESGSADPGLKEKCFRASTANLPEVGEPGTTTPSAAVDVAARRGGESSDQVVPLTGPNKPAAPLALSAGYCYFTPRDEDCFGTTTAAETEKRTREEVPPLEASSNIEVAPSPSYRGQMTVDCPASREGWRDGGVDDDDDSTTTGQLRPADGINSRSMQCGDVTAGEILALAESAMTRLKVQAKSLHASS